MTYEEAVAAVQPGRYRHFKGREYEVIAVARHSETEEPMVVYRALYGEQALWVRPASMWNEQITRDGARSILEPAVKAHNQLNTIEDSVVMGRFLHRREERCRL